MRELKKKPLITVLILISIIFLGFLISKKPVNCDIEVKNKNLNCDVKIKGLKNARDFTVDEEGNYYIAYENSIEKIDKNGKVTLIKEKNIFNINSIEYNNNSLYFCSDNNLYAYNLHDNRIKILMNNIPSIGDYSQCKILIDENNIYIAIGAATNSGVVGEDNVWLKDQPFLHDITPKSITVKGNEYNGTGAFVPFNTKNIKGQVIPQTFPGNSCVIKYNIAKSRASLFCWGIRNIIKMDFNSEGRIFGTVGGMENRGSRPIKGDKDYIYEIKEGKWYGWPDYSGGDPVTSPRFIGKNNTKIEFILENHPTTNPMSPIYQHKSLSTIGELAVDKKAILNNKDCIYFYDIDDNTIYSLNKQSTIKPEIILNKSQNVSLKFTNENLSVMDKDEGIIFSVFKDGNRKEYNVLNSKSIYIILVVLGISIIGVAWKVVNR